jgi:hypothetical protein
LTDITTIKRVIDIEYGDIVNNSLIYRDKLRVFIIDSSLVDIWFSKVIPDRFSFHWERRHIDGTLYRYDNFPDPRWKLVSTYPEHFHNGSQSQVQASNLCRDRLQSIHEFMDFIKSTLH